MNDNIKEMLMSKNMDDVKFALEICKRTDVPIIEIDDIYAKVGFSHKNMTEMLNWIETYEQYLQRWPTVNWNRENGGTKYFKSWK